MPRSKNQMINDVHAALTELSSISDADMVERAMMSFNKLHQKKNGPNHGKFTAMFNNIETLRRECELVNDLRVNRNTESDNLMCDLLRKLRDASRASALMLEADQMWEV